MSVDDECDGVCLNVRAGFKILKRLTAPRTERKKAAFIRPQEHHTPPVVDMTPLLAGENSGNHLRLPVVASIARIPPRGLDRGQLVFSVARIKPSV